MIDGEALVFWKNIFITPAGSGQETDARVIGAINVLSNLRHSKQFAQDVSYVPASSYDDGSSLVGTQECVVGSSLSDMMAQQLK